MLEGPGRAVGWRDGPWLGTGYVQEVVTSQESKCPVAAVTGTLMWLV